MNVIAVDPEDPRVADYVRLREVSLRKHLEARHGLFIAEGELVIRRAVAAGYPVRSFLMSPRWLEPLADLVSATGSPCYLLEPEQLEQLTGFDVHRGALASMHRLPLPSVADVLPRGRAVGTSEDSVDRPDAGPSKPPARTRSRIAVLEDLVDHTNVGAVFRSAAAIGVDAVLVTPRCADPLYRRSVKVSMGAVFQVPWTRIDPWPGGIEWLKEAGYVVAGMTLGAGAITLDELAARDHPRLALVFGSEGHGLTAEANRRLEAKVTIPMLNGVDSLNVAASSAVAFYATR